MARPENKARGQMKTTEKYKPMSDAIANTIEQAHTVNRPKRIS